MKKTIQGIRYDTEKATLIGQGLGPAEFRSDFSWWEAGLYVTPISGRYFLAGEGGPMTTFGRTMEDGARGWGEKIIPIDRAEALKWGERFLSEDEIKKGFGDLIEDDA